MATAKKSTPNFGQATARFREAGIPARALLPIAPVDAKVSGVGDLDDKNLGKAPGRYNSRSKDWRGLGGFYTSDGVPKGEIPAMHEWPTPNAGILGRFAPGIDSDAETEDARRLVERALAATFGDNACYAERIRGTGPRRLYAFRCADPADDAEIVRTRHLSYRLKGEDDRHPLHKIDVIGFGNQYLITGTHPSGDAYQWAPDWDLADLFASGEIERIGNSDIVRFVEIFRELLEAEGGEITRTTGGRAAGEERDYSGEDPLFPVKDIFAGLDRIPNNADNFETRDEFVSMLARIRAALGSEAEAERDRVEEWACQDPDWCAPEYFDKCWDSLERGVRVDRDSLDRIFKRAGVFTSAVVEFDGAGPANMTAVREKAKQTRDDRTDLMEDVASKYIFGRVNTATDDGVLRMRSTMEPAVEWRAIDWWKFRSEDQNTDLVLALQDDHFERDEAGMWEFVRALRRFEMADKDRRLFYTGITRDPNYDRGEIVSELNPDGSLTRELNMRYLSPVIRHARRKGFKQNRKDVETILEFGGRVFGELWKYELHTLAYMAQTGRRPGHMLLLVGESGVGKSTYIQMLISMFDGIGKDMGGQIDGTKMTNEAARRFALARTEGCRIISIKELPEGSTAHNMAAVTASIKQIVDPGMDGDYYQIEAKGKDSRSVRNFARVVASSNYNNSLLIEENDRRIFFVRCQIDLDNKPELDYYAAVNGVTSNPQRLASFWDYLLDLDVSDYDPAAAPPVSREKREAQIAGLPAWDRHFQAALETLRAAKRSLFDLAELGELMTAMAENEHAGTDGRVDDRKVYDFGKAGGGATSSLKRLHRYAVKLLRPKVNGERLSPVYGLRTARPLLDQLGGADRDDILDALDRDRDGNALSRVHTWPVFDGPTKPARQR
jgi:energy-coupling factor transporter ATP-binding protein EcfA2